MAASLRRPAEMSRSRRSAVPDPTARPLPDLVAALRSCANRYGSGPAARKAALLRECAASAITDPAALLVYHDCLLFLLAYPESTALHAAAKQELVRVAAAARVMIEAGPARVRARLANSGVAWAPMTIAFGYDIARWLVGSHPGHGEIDSFDETGEPLPALMRHALPAMEFELLAAEDTGSEDFLGKASAGRRGSRLEWLVAQFANLPCSDGLREQLFDSLKTFITISPGATKLSRTFVRGLAVKTYVHRGNLQRVVDPIALIARPLAPPVAIARAERLHLLDAGRAMLASLGRETDAIAAAEPEGIEYHALGRGIAIALYTMAPGRRLPLDSHVGFMLFKNSIPVGYGGGWPFLGTAKIGVNIFAPFRGGESAYLFCQVLRVYSQRFGIDHFIAEPSQYGGGNREGLLSGAFWFYYRLGFRPVAPHLVTLASEEYARMRRNQRYRPPLPVLRRFTRSDIELRLHNGAAVHPVCDPADLSLTVSAWVASRFRGDRTKAAAFAVRNVARALGATGIARWPPAERAAFLSFCLLLASIPDLARWPARDRAQVIALARAKGGDEFRYFDLLRVHTRLQAALRDISNQGG
jgi:hypothetical protein